MGTTLQHGIFLPAEGERNCYAGLASNWTILDGMIGGYSSHAANLTIHVTAADKETWNGKADASALTAHTGDTTIHVTAEDKQAWNGKADASALTAHTGDTTIHVTSADKQAWNGKQDALSQTQLDAVNSGIDSTKVQQIATNTSDISSLQSGKANDSNVVHKSGNESVGGVKTFVNIPVFTNFDGIRFRCAHNPNAYVTFRNANQANPGSIIFSAHDGNTGTAFHLVDKTLIPYNTNDIDLGTTSRKWKSFNGLNPGTLSLPDLSNGIDISGYFTVGTSSNSYTPIAGGWICIKGVSTLGSAGIYVESTKGFYASALNLLGMNSNLRFVNLSFPVVKGEQYTIVLKSVDTSIVAKFFPCLGNV